MGRWADSGQRYIDQVAEIEDFRSTGLVPTEEQARYTPQEKTLVNVTVNAGITTNFTANAVNFDGFTGVGVVVIPNTTHNFGIAAVSSPDGALTVANIATQATSSNSGKHVVGDVPSQFVIVQIQNNDAATQTYNAWVRKMNK